MDQNELWPAANRPKVLRCSLERLWTEGDQVWALSTAMTGTKTSEALWVATQELRGDGAPLVAAAIVQATMLRMDGPQWSSKPKAQAQERWERHLFTF